MRSLPEELELTGVPAHVQSWCAARIPGFVRAVLARWQRAHGELPRRFSLALCPQTEINARGGLPARVVELTHPRLTCRHFTGCHKPYYVVIYPGADAAEAWRREMRSLLPWCETYEVDTGGPRLRLEFRGASEELDDEAPPPHPRRTLQDLLEQGELVSILA